jgi:hypothetical protein
MVFAAGCVTTPGPKGWLSTPEHSITEAFGAWLVVEHGLESSGSTSEGEFIAVDEIRVWLLSQDGLRSIPIVDVTGLTLAVYMDKRAAGIWTFLGSLSTASHGYALVVSLPIWLAAGLYNTGAESSGGISIYKKVDWEAIRRYARFPQGMPEGLDHKLLKPKDYEKK